MTAWGQVHRTLAAHAQGVTAAVLEGVATSGPRPPGHALQLALRSAFQIGLEVGIAVGARDQAAARRLLAFFDTAVQNGDPEALSSRDRNVDELIASTRTDA